jgi:hypothetical protein
MQGTMRDEMTRRPCMRRHVRRRGASPRDTRVLRTPVYVLSLVSRDASSRFPSMPHSHCTRTGRRQTTQQARPPARATCVSQSRRDEGLCGSTLRRGCFLGLMKKACCSPHVPTPKGRARRGWGQCRTGHPPLSDIKRRSQSPLARTPWQGKKSRLQIGALKPGCPCRGYGSHDAPFLARAKKMKVLEKPMMPSAR